MMEIIQSMDWDSFMWGAVAMGIFGSFGVFIMFLLGEGA